ncbi:MAG: transketolase [Geobacteraceae bacterium]|nr:transketolase [Geobacteraceae bacterium]
MARSIRRDIIEMAYSSSAPHVGSALSCADILTVLYSGILKLDPWDSRDKFILSKAHASTALYAALAAKGIMHRDLLATYCKPGGCLPAHLDMTVAPGIECSAGSLGHGFNIGLGMAYGFKQQRSARRVYALVGDGETQEGSIWEGALFAPTMGLDNFTAIIDCNNLQGYGRPTEVCSFEPVAEKWRAFGWQVCEADGHDHGALLAAFAEDSCGRPKVVVARTIKGKGVSFMENELIWHYYIVTAEHRARALEEIG